MGGKRIAVKKDSPAKKPPASPKKTLKTVPTSPTKKKGLTLTVFSFDALPEIEVFLFTKNDVDDGYLGSLRDYLNGNLEKHDDIDALNIHSLVDRRIAGSANRSMPQEDKPQYNRSLFFRYPMTGQSTIETRQGALQTLKRFFGNEGFNYHKYPITNITLSDKTDELKFSKLDDWFKDETIQTILENDIAEQYQNDDFVDVFPDYAKRLLRGPHFGPFAKKLGFARLVYDEDSDEDE